MRTKGARDAVAALAHLRDVAVGSTWSGDGFDRAPASGWPASLGVADRVGSTARQPRQDVSTAGTTRADVFVFPQLPGARRQRGPRGDGPRAAGDRHRPRRARQPRHRRVRGAAARTDAEQLAVDLADAVRRLGRRSRRPGRDGRRGAGAGGRRRAVGARSTRWEPLYEEVVQATNEGRAAPTARRRAQRIKGGMY